MQPAWHGWLPNSADRVHTTLEGRFNWFILFSHAAALPSAGNLHDARSLFHINISVHFTKLESKWDRCSAGGACAKSKSNSWEGHDGRWCSTISYGYMYAHIVHSKIIDSDQCTYMYAYVCLKKNRA
jgi:hypothetical protein